MRRHEGAGASGRQSRGAIIGTLTAAIFVVVVLVLNLAAANAAAYTPGSYGGTTIEPEPAMVGPITFADHSASWPLLGYQTAAGVNETLDAVPAGSFPTDGSSGPYANPITIDTADIVAPGVLQGERVGASYWNGSTSPPLGSYGATPAQGWYSAQCETSSCSGSGAGFGGGSVLGLASVAWNGEYAVQYSFNDSTHSTTPTANLYYVVPTTGFLSASPEYDYLTVAVQATGPACPTSSGCDFGVAIGNVSTQSGSVTAYYPVSKGSTGLASEGTTSGYQVAWTNGAALSSSIYLSVPLSLFTSLSFEPSGVSRAAVIEITVVLPAAHTTAAYDVTVASLGMTTLPLTLGTTEWGASAAGNVTQAVFAGDANLSAFSPSFSYTSILSGGLTVDVAQTAQSLPSGNVTISEVANGNGSEEVTYTMSFWLPTAPGLSYGATSSWYLYDIIPLQEWQYIDVGWSGEGVTGPVHSAPDSGSLLSYYQENAGTDARTVVVSAVSPNAGGTWDASVIYTSAEWNAISSVPSLFSAGGIEYWWGALVLAILSGIGLGGFAVYARDRQAARRVR